MLCSKDPILELFLCLSATAWGFGYVYYTQFWHRCFADDNHNKFVDEYHLFRNCGVNYATKDLEINEKIFKDFQFHASS
ncbi:hypothetical protein L6452_20276 [Arctium lappa]|uniref:Uncharacterized protein n=1 Tax=Arctium lappa TaxID=4217 RepID=A0ACB9BBS7_ARCLA|nr:hypothetical protein L6452_20276 [Arctium lappa]